MTKRPARPTTHLEIVGKEWLSPHMLRLFFGGDNFEAFEDRGFADAYIKLLFAPDGRAYPQPIDNAAIRAERPSTEWPTTRTYTVRSVDTGARRIAVDFVIHGDSGIAAPWAVAVEIGDLVQFVGPGGAWSPVAEADFHLFVGDESSAPAIAAGLERLPSDAVGAVVIEASKHPLELPAPEGVNVQWTVRGDKPYAPNVLAELVRGLELPDAADLSVFAHGEREAMKGLRKVFKELEIPRERLSISGYWAYGRIEDEFQAEKRTPIGEV